MFVNYIKIGLRNLLKNKLFSVINILGMALSLSIVFIIALFVRDELQYDQHISKSKTKYRLYNIRQATDGVTNKLPIVPYPFAAYLKKDFPEIRNTLRIMDTYGDVLFELDEKRINENGGIYAEPALFDMLEIRVIEGDGTNALVKPNTVALSESLARKYFGDEKAIGKIIRISKEDYEVTAVYEDLPRQSHIRPAFALSMQTIARNWSSQRTENWIWQQFFTYLEFNHPVDENEFNAKLLAFVKKYAYAKTEADGFKYTPYLQQVRDIHLRSSDFEWEIAERGSEQTVYILGITALLIVIIACLNFINLSTARSMKRMKEVGVRKVVGAYRKQLIFQFVTESVIFTLLGLMLAVACVEITLPYLNAFTEKQIVDPMNISTVTVLIFFAVVLGIFAGSYPAFHISGLRPTLIFREKNTGVGAAELFRKSLVVLQFAFSFFLIIGAMIVVAQHDMLLNRDMGFTKEQLVVIPLQRAHLANPESTKQQFLNVPHVAKATLAYGIPGNIVAGDGVIDPVSNRMLPTNLFLVDEDYIPTFEMKLVAGRNFSPSRSSDRSGAFVLNETAIKSFGLGDPSTAIGKTLHWEQWGKDSLMRGEIIGVVKDFNFRTLKEKVAPAVMLIYPEAYSAITVRIEGGNVQTTLQELKKVYETITPEWPFEYSFLDKRYEEMYKNESKLSSLLTYFTGFAIFIACLGLFGLVEYSVHQRAREISIRKVFGAGTGSLVLLLTKRYFMLITLAFVLVIPLSYYAANEWLQNFAYHIQVSPLIFIKAAALMVLVTVMTVSYQSVKAALSNPATILKND
jgi:putative ABC transport system permease protein